MPWGLALFIMHANPVMGTWILSWLWTSSFGLFKFEAVISGVSTQSVSLFWYCGSE